MQGTPKHDQIAERWETQNEAGRRFFGRGDFARAEQAFAAAVREAEQLGAGDLRLATSLANLAQLKLRQKNHDESERLFRRSLQIREAALGHDHASLVQTVNGLAAVCYARGDVDAAEPLFQRALAITERRLGAQHPDIVVSLNSLARIAFKRNDHAAAGPLLERLLLLKASALGPDHPEAAPILTSLVKVRCAEGALDEAERLTRRVVAIREAEQPPNETSLASSLELMADVLARLGKRDEEASARQRATALRGHRAATAGLMPLSQRSTPETPEATAGLMPLSPRRTPDTAGLMPPSQQRTPDTAGLMPMSQRSTPETPEDVFDPHPTPSGLRAKLEPPAPKPPSLGDITFLLPDPVIEKPITPIPRTPANVPASPITAMPLISMDAPVNEIVTRRKTPTASPPPLPDTPRVAAVEPNAVEGAGSELVPMRIQAPPPPKPAPVAHPHPVRHQEPRRPPARRRRRETSAPRPRRGGGRKILVTLAVVLAVGGGVAAMGRGGVIESRGVTGAPARVFKTPPRRVRTAPAPRPKMDSIAASVRDSVALLLVGEPPAQPQQPPTRSPEVNVPARGGRGDPLAHQIKQMLPDSNTRQAEPPQQPR